MKKQLLPNQVIKLLNLKFNCSAKILENLNGFTYLRDENVLSGSNPLYIRWQDTSNIKIFAVIIQNKAYNLYGCEPIYRNINLNYLKYLKKNDLKDTLENLIKFKKHIETPKQNVLKLKFYD